MLEGLQEELNNNRWSQYQTASNELKMAVLNADGSALIETWAVKQEELKVPKGDMLALLSKSSIANIIRWMRAEADDDALAFHELYIAHDQFTVTFPVFRQFIELLAALGHISGSEKNTILRLGERSISRAEELFGRKLAMEDFE